MFKDYLEVGIMNILKNKIFTFINVFGVIASIFIYLSKLNI